MATTIRQAGLSPASYPPAPDGLSAAAEELDSAMVWQRIEAYIAWRYSERDVEWIVEGPGEWHAPLAPATISTVEVWSRAGEFEDATLKPSPYGGYYLPCTGPYRFTATVGADVTVPATVSTAFVRLADYMAAKPGTAGATSERTRAGSVEVEKSRSESWMAAAMQNSGAADLLRSYRRV